MDKIFPKISIIIPVYNVEEYLCKCIDSVLSQTYTNLEVILVNDGSKDNCALICDSYVGKDDRIKVIHQDNQGVSAARNRGIDIASGEYIGFVDSDDYIELDMYEILYNLLQKTNSDISCISTVNYGKLSNQLPYVDDTTVHIYNSEQAIRNMLYDNTTTCGHLFNKLFKTSLFTNLRLDTSIKIREDALIMWELFHRSSKIAFQNLHKYHYLYHAKSAVHSFSPSFFTSREACLRILDKTKINYQNIVSYSQYYLIGADIQIIVRMIEANCLDKKEYSILKREIKHNLTKQVKSLFPPRKKYSMFLILINTNLYKIIKKVFEKLKVS